MATPLILLEPRKSVDNDFTEAVIFKGASIQTRFIENSYTMAHKRFNYEDQDLQRFTFLRNSPSR